MPDPALAAHTWRDSPIPSYSHTNTPTPAIIRLSDPTHPGITLVPPETCLSLSALTFDTFPMHTRVPTPLPLLPLAFPAIPRTSAVRSLISTFAVPHSLGVHQHQNLPAPCTSPSVLISHTPIPGGRANPRCSPASPDSHGNQGC